LAVDLEEREVAMFAVVGEVSIDAGREDESTDFLKANIVPRVKQAPGLVGGYWLSVQDGKGLGFTLFETEEAARRAAEMAKDQPRPDYITSADFNVREVIAQT
jgi:hypothetical protein